MLKRLLRFIMIAACLAAAWMNAGSASEEGAAHPGSLSITAGSQAAALGSSSSSSVERPGPLPAASAVETAQSSEPSDGEPVDTDPNGTVRVVGILTDISKKYMFLVPNLPLPTLQKRRQWFKDRGISVHCALEWKDDKGKWWFAEMRSMKWDNGSTVHRVGLGQFPGTGYLAYGIFITPGRVPRSIDLLGRTITVACDFTVKCEYKKLEAEIRKYGAFGKKPGDPGTGGYGKENCGLGGPAYKPAQNSNTLVGYVLRKCGAPTPAPDRATGWDREPTFPYSTDTRYPKYGE